MASILDQFGNPIKPKSLTTEFAPPTLANVRSPFSGHPADNLTPNKLANLLRSAANGEPEAYFELAEDMEERDLHYHAVLSTRKRAVAQLPITVEAASDDKAHVEHADFIRRWLKKKVLSKALFNILDAVGKGYSVSELIWEVNGNHWFIKEIKHRPQRWFKPIKDDGETLVLNESGNEQPLPEQQFLIHRHPSKTGLTVRSGLARIAAWSYMYKSYTLKDWAIFVQNYAMPLRTGRYATNASEEEKAILWRAVKNVAGDMAAIFPDTMDIKFEEIAAKGTTVDIYERRADWMDRQVSKAVLGQTTTTDAISGGHAVSKEHRLVQEDIERSDAELVGTSINQQIIQNLISFNFGPQEDYPIIKIGRPDELAVDKIADTIQKTGVRVEASWLRDKIGAPEPAEDAETLGGNAAQRVFEEPSKPQLNLSKILNSRSEREATDPIIEKLTQRMERDTAGAMAGLTEQIRAVLMSASSLQEASENLLQLKLDPSQLSIAMTRAMALSHLAGEAALLNEITKSK